MARLADEHWRLAAIARDIEALLADSPGLAEAMTAAERATLQQLDYLRQGIECLGLILSRMPGGPAVDLAALTRGLALDDLAARVRGETPRPGAWAEPREVDFFG